jgi:tetratricopeptide (TPR) repeat protein
LEATATSSARPADAIPLYEASLQIARETGDRTTEAYVLANLGVAFRAVRDLGAARLCLLEAIAIFRGSGSSSAEGGACLHELAAVDLAEGDARLALVRLAEGEELLRGRGHVIEYGKLLCRRAEAWLALGDEAAARAAIREAESVLEETGAGANSDLARGIAELRRRL